jgi:hypothetical protein
MTASLARQIVLAARPNGKPQLSDFRLEETEVPAPASGQLLLAVQYLSLDPYMRGRMDDRKSYAKPLQLGDVRTRADCRRRQLSGVFLRDFGIFLRRGTDGSQTRRWREQDSNPRSRFTSSPFRVERFSIRLFIRPRPRAVDAGSS